MIKKDVINFAISPLQNSLIQNKTKNIDIILGLHSKNIPAHHNTSLIKRKNEHFSLINEEYSVNATRQNSLVKTYDNQPYYKKLLKNHYIIFASDIFAKNNKICTE